MNQNRKNEKRGARRAIEPRSHRVDVHPNFRNIVANACGVNVIPTREENPYTVDEGEYAEKIWTQEATEGLR